MFLGGKAENNVSKETLIKNDLILLDEATSSVDVESERKINEVIVKK